VAILCSFGSCLAGVTVKQNVSPGATSWPGTPLVQTLGNPASQATVAESFNSVPACTNYTETFTISANSTLQTISIYAGGGTGTGGSTNIVLRLFDLGSQTAPNPSPYTPGTDLFNSGNGLSITYTPQTPGILEFDFTGNDQVSLQAGHMYAFEIDGALNSSPLAWQRATSDTYSGGAAYRNRAWINGTSARDFAMAVYSATAFNTNYPPVPYGIVLHIFTKPVNGANPDGANPAASLTFSSGMMCGTTVNGGLQAAGTAFYLAPDVSAFNAFRSFSSTPDAANPQADLTASGTRLFGSSFGGGTSGVGTLFVGQTNGTVSLLRSFTTVSADNATNSGGASPTALIALSANTLYGTTTAGGAFANGTVFSLNTNGSPFSTLHNFTLLDSLTGTNDDGALPWGGLILIRDTLYGTASAGGAGGSGVVFSIGTNGANFTTLHSFNAMDTLAATNSDGALPLAGLVFSNQTLYGTTSAGGTAGRGTLFSIQTNGLGFTVLHHFSASDPVTGTNSEGAAPSAPLIISGNTLYGTAPLGGPAANGTVYSLKTDGTQFKTLYPFTAINPSTGTNADGAFPSGGLLLLSNSLYGVTYGGGPGTVGTVFTLPLPAVITSIVKNVDGTASLYFLGVPNSTNIIQSSLTLESPISWQPLSTNIADPSGAWQFTDTATNHTRFYRSYAR
jgi:uncharacterized repeat protein (TIGR03803 family)